MKRFFTCLFATLVLTTIFGQQITQKTGREHVTEQVVYSSIINSKQPAKETAIQKDTSAVMQVVSDGELEQLSQSTMTQIGKNTKDTADNTRKGGYEILTIVISSLAFLTAFITLIISRLTYKSQEQTRKNTTPVFTKEKQYEVLISIAESLMDQIFHAYVIKYNLKRSDKSSIPSGLLFDPIYIDTSELHLELFYEEKGDMWIETSKAYSMGGKTKYAKLSSLKHEIDSFNKGYEIITQQVQDNILDIETIKHEYYVYVVRGLLCLLGSVAYVTDAIFNKKVDVITHIIQYVYHEMIMKACGGLQISTFDGVSTISFEEIKLEDVKKEMFEKMPDIKKLFNGEKDVWDSFFFNRNSTFDFEISNLKRIDMNTDEFMGYVMICV